MVEQDWVGILALAYAISLGWAGIGITGHYLYEPMVYLTVPFMILAFVGILFCAIGLPVVLVLHKLGVVL